MNKFLRIGFFSVALAQSLYGVDATAWWQLDENQTNPPPNTLTIFEDSTLTLTSVTNPQIGGQQYGGNIEFDHNLNVFLEVDKQIQNNQSTTIYKLNQKVRNIFNGDGTLNIIVNAPNKYAKSIFDLDNSTLVIDNKINISATEGSNVFSIIRTGNVGGSATFETNQDLIVDLSGAKGTFNVAGSQILNRKVIFDNSGFININTFNSKEVITQLSGDIFNNGIFTLNLHNTQSFFNGRYDTSVASNGNFNLSDGSNMNSDILFDNGGIATLNINLSSKAIAKLRTIFRLNGTTFNIRADDAILYADFDYHAKATVAQGNITLTNGAVWYPSKDNTINVLTINNPQNLINTEQLKSLNGLSAVDLRFGDQEGTLRTHITMDETNRHTIKTSNIQGANGIFRIFGVFNQNGWTKSLNQAGVFQETIATDQIITGQLFNTHYIQVFWNQNNFDKSMLNKNLEEYKIIVAKQEDPNPVSEFVGVVTPIGVYNYITNLKKETYTLPQNNPKQTGQQWIVSNVQRADNSYLSKLLDSLFQTQFRIEKTQIDTLNLRMGELRKLNRVHSVWARTKYGRLGSKETNQTIGSWDEYASIWLGYDQNFYVLGGKNFLGGSFDVQFFNSYGLPNKDDFTNPSYTGRSQSYGFSVYDTFFFDNGFYIDALAKYYFTHNRFTIASEVLAGNIPHFFSHNFLASLEVGKRFKLPVKLATSPKDYLYLKPDAGMSFAFSSGQDWNFMDWSNQPVDARLDFNAPVSMRTGLTFGWTWNSRGYEGDLYAGTSFEYDFNTGGDLRLDDFLDRMTLTHGGNFNWRINAGTNVILNEYWRIYFDVDTAFFGTINSTFTLNAGVRINFGRLHPQMPYIPPYMDIPEPDAGKYSKWRRTIPEVQNYETEGILDNYSGNRKRPIYKPKIKIRQKPFEGTQIPQTEQIQQLKIQPQVEQKPKGAPEFIDNPEKVDAPTQNYKRDTNVPMYQNTNPQQNKRSMDSIKENYNRGYR